MRRIDRFRIAFALCAIVLVAGACKKREQPATSTAPEPGAPGITYTAPAAAVRVTEVQVGKSLGPDKKVSAASDTFAPKDTIFASVSTEGSGTATVHAKWTFQDGQVVKEDSRSISPTGPAVTEFSIQKPGGWPKGNYKVEISLDGTPAATKEFRVE